MPAGQAAGTATAGGAVAVAAGAAASTGAAAGGAEAAAAAATRWDCWDCRVLETGPGHAAEEKSSQWINAQSFCGSLKSLQPNNLNFGP